MNKDEKVPFERLLVQGIRLAIYLVILGLAAYQRISEGAVFKSALPSQMLVIALLGVLFHGICFVQVGRLFSMRRLLGLTFIFDFILLSALFYQTKLNPSIFLFLDLLVILLSGLTFGVRGALLLAGGFSVTTTLIMAIGPEVKTLSFFFLVVLNNISFFSLASISGFLADQLEIQGLSLSALRKMNEKIVETVPSGLITIDQAGKILTLNPPAQTIFKIDQSQNEFHSIAELLPGFLWQDCVGRGKIEHRAPRGDDVSIFSIEVLKTSDQEMPSYLVVVDDRTELSKLEYAVRQSEKLAAVGQLAAGIAHEIRNPLAGISGSIELLSQNYQTEEDRKLSKIILREIDRLNLLISEFLDYAKPDKPPVDIVDLSELVRGVLDMVKLDSKLPANVEQERALKSGLLMRAHSDKLKQAILNIVMNAYQAMEKSETKRLTILGDVNGRQVSLVFKDTGCGMTAETQKRMFEAFHTTKPKGTGLGLAITWKCLENHQGQVFVESQVGIGTSFEIRFPFAG